MSEEAPALPAAAASATATGDATAKPTTVLELFPGIDEKDKTIPKPKDVVFRFGTAGFRTKVISEVRRWLCYFCLITFASSWFNRGTF